MNPKNLLYLLPFLLFLHSCMKEKTQPPINHVVEADFRENYIGAYEMHVNGYHWKMGEDSYWTNDTVIGEVFVYDSSAVIPNIQNTFSPFNNSAETAQGLTIKFTNTYHSHCFIKKDDTIRNAEGYHYKHSGYFTPDSIYLNVTGLGSLGGGSDYFTKGRKL